MIRSFLKLLARCSRLALPYGRFRLFAVVCMIFFNGLLQLVGVSSVFPFFALASDPHRIRNSKLGGWILNFLPPMEENHLLILAGCFAILMLFVAGIGSIASDSIRVLYSYGFSHWLKGRLLRSYAQRPYSYFLSRNSASMHQRVIDIFSFTYNVMLPLGEAFSKIILIFLLLAGFFFVQPFAAVGAMMIFGGFYLFVFVVLRPRTRAVAQGQEFHTKGFSKSTLQFLQGIKPIMIHGKESFFIKEALRHSAGMRRFQAQVPIFSNGPRYLIEPIAFGGLVAIVIALAMQGRPFSDILPNLSVMALVGYRLLPSMSLLYGQMVTIASNSYTLQQLEEEILQIEKEVSGVEKSSVSELPLSFTRDIRIEGICFAYTGSGKNTLENFSLTVAKNESVGIAGASGSGKSTLVDLILGLHAPASGEILVDGVPLTHNNIMSWRAMIGYVPQDIYLLDDTLEANIAFGIPPEEVDKSAMRAAAEAAQILNFIEKELPEGFNTMVGERGVRLSGGQRQRIGLARALYHRPQVLILDEATSALDLQTETAVIQTINALQGTVTIIAIAHRLSTLERCDRTIHLVRNSSPDFSKEKP
jgi:ABC-type multidrug transport system fused ATPase/permease subunit